MSQQAAFMRDGFLVLPNLYSKRQIRAVLRSIQHKIETEADRIVTDDLADSRRMSLQASRQQRPDARVKINDLYLETPEVRSIALNNLMSPVLTELLGSTPLLCNSLYFEKGSTQPKHIDSLYMTPVTVNNLIAIWVALEDAHPDSGPLEYYPGSHAIEPLKFNDGTYHATDEEMPKWNAYITAECERLGLQKQSFNAKQGDVFIWHANLLHGGGPIKDLNRTRKSLVFHYFSILDASFAIGEKIAEGGAFWLKRSPQTIPSGAEERPFSETSYLALHPDVRRAVEQGQFTSGQHHYDVFGKTEGRVTS